MVEIEREYQIGRLGLLTFVLGGALTGILLGTFADAQPVLAIKGGFMVTLIFGGLLLGHIYGGLVYDDTPIGGRTLLLGGLGVAGLIVIQYAVLVLVPNLYSATSLQAVSYFFVYPFQQLDQPIELSRQAITLFFFTAAVGEEAFFRAGVHGIVRNQADSVIWAIIASTGAWLMAHLFVFGTQPPLLFIVIGGSILLSVLYEVTGRWEVPAIAHSFLNILAVI